MAQVIISPETKASGKLRIVTGTVALDGSNPTSVDLSGKLHTIVAASLSLAGSSAPGVGTSVLTYAASDAVLSIYAWKVTGAGDTTLVASTGTETVSYAVIGY
jgi:hypothetical protein